MDTEGTLLPETAEAASDRYEQLGSTAQVVVRAVTKSMAFDREEYEVYDYEKRLPKRFMSEKSSTSVYIGAPEEFADWIGYPVDELLNGAAETSTDTQQSASTEGESDMNDSGGFFSRLLGN